MNEGKDVTRSSSSNTSFASIMSATVVVFALSTITIIERFWLAFFSILKFLNERVFAQFSRNLIKLHVRNSIQVAHNSNCLAIEMSRKQLFICDLLQRREIGFLHRNDRRQFTNASLRLADKLLVHNNMIKVRKLITELTIFSPFSTFHFFLCQIDSYACT